MWDDGYGWRPYESVAMRRRRAARAVAALRRDGRAVDPVEVEGRPIARTFWGQAWCRNLEAYSDFANRLPRGRSYVRSGAVVDLAVAAGEVRALVSGSSLYDVTISVRPLSRRRWTTITSRCAGQIESMIELLRGTMSRHVMEVVTRPGDGLFPEPRHIALGCTCPDWATMCKHVAAVLYGIGARLDRQPALLFTLRGVDPAELVTAAVGDTAAMTARGGRRRLQTDDLSAVFGIALDDGRARAPAAKTAKTKKTTTTRTARTPGARRRPSTRKKKK